MPWPIAGADAVKRVALSDMAREFAIFAAALGEGPYVLGETFSAVDIYAAMLATQPRRARPGGLECRRSRLLRQASQHQGAARPRRGKAAHRQGLGAE